MNSAASFPVLARDWFCALQPEARAEVRTQSLAAGINGYIAR